MDRAELADVVVQAFSASLTRLASVEGLTLELGAAWAKRENGLLCKFATKCVLYDAKVDDENEAFESKHLLARLNCRIVCEYEIPAVHMDSLAYVNPELMKEFSQEIAFPAAFPYLREAISSMASRLGFPRLTLGVFRPGAEMTFTLRTV